MIILGIDPGSKGGISVLQDKKVIFSQPFNNQTLCDILKRYHFDIVAVEQVHSMPVDGKKQCFSFGANYGFIIGALTVYEYEIHYVAPQKWKKYYGLIKQDKQASIDKCKELFNVNLLPTIRCKKEHDGMAESILIANYIRDGTYGITEK